MLLLWLSNDLLSPSIILSSIGLALYYSFELVLSPRGDLSSIRIREIGYCFTIDLALSRIMGTAMERGTSLGRNRSIRRNVQEKMHNVRIEGGN